MMILAAGLVCLAACQNGVLSPEEEENAATITYIRANEESSAATKASIDNSTAAFTWNTNDRVAVYTTDGYKISNGLADTYDGTNAATFAFSGDNAVTEANRTDFAIFPASLVWDGTSIRLSSANNHTATSLTLTLPDSYTLEQVKNDVSPCPMIATNAPDGDLSFKHLCALLRVTVSDVPATTRRLVFVFNGNKVQGEFTLNEVVPGTSGIVTAAASGLDNTITVFTPDIDAVSTVTVNLPLPTGTYDYITISAYDRAEGGLPIYTKTRLIKNSDPGTWTSDRLSSRKISAALNQIAFSVSSTKKVIFAPGNLQATYNATTKTWTWGFAANQYDFIGSTGGNNFITTSIKEDAEPYAKLSGNGTVDLFGWSTESTYYGIATSEQKTDYSGSFVDWGSMNIDGRGENYWRTLSCGNETSYEWHYIIHDRATGVNVNGTDNARYTKAILNTGSSTIKGLILFPENYEGPSNNTSDITWGPINGQTSDFGTTLNLKGWNLLQSAGCVFLPAAGSRYPTTEYVNERAYYAGSSTGKYFLWVESSQIYWNMTSAYGRGRAVRLVHNL